METQRAGTHTCRLIIFLILEGKKSSSKLDVPRRFSQRRKIYKINKKYEMHTERNRDNESQSCLSVFAPLIACRGNDVESDVKLSLTSNSKCCSSQKRVWQKALRSGATQ